MICRNCGEPVYFNTKSKIYEYACLCDVIKEGDSVHMYRDINDDEISNKVDMEGDLKLKPLEDNYGGIANFPLPQGTWEPAHKSKVIPVLKYDEIAKQLEVCGLVCKGKYVDAIGKLIDINYINGLMAVKCDEFYRLMAIERKYNQIKSFALDEVEG